MADPAGLPRAVVLAVLKKHNKLVRPQPDDPGITVISDGRSVLRSIRFLPTVEGRLIDRVANLFGIPIPDFYQEAMRRQREEDNTGEG